MASLDVFISYAGKNEPHARALYEALAKNLEKDRVFFDQEQLPGAEWFEDAPTALGNSRLTAAILTHGPDGGWYNKAEIILALEKMRQGNHALVLVFVGGVPGVDEWPFGTQNLVPIDVEAVGGMEATTKKLIERLASIPELDSPQPRRRRIRTNRELLNAALHLDRTDQWGAIQRIAHGNANAYFLLYGQTFQNLRLFLERIHHYLGKEVRPHLVLELDYRFDGNYVSSVAEWELQLAEELRNKLNRRSGKLEILLAAAASTQPLFLIIELPCSLRFEEPHQRALQGFLEKRWPELMGGAGGLGKRLLVAAEYQESESSRHRDIADWMRASVGGNITYEPMAEVQTPTRAEVVVFLQRCGFEDDDPEFEDIMKGYDQIAEDPSLDFGRLSSFLDRQLGNPAVFFPSTNGGSEEEVDESDDEDPAKETESDEEVEK